MSNSKSNAEKSLKQKIVENEVAIRNDESVMSSVVENEVKSFYNFWLSILFVFIIYKINIFSIMAEETQSSVSLVHVRDRNYRE